MLPRPLAIAIPLLAASGLFSPAVAPASANDLVIPTGGRVSLELITSEAAFRNTLSIVSPAIAVALSGSGSSRLVGSGAFTC